MVRHTLNILQQMLQDFYSVSDHFGTLCIKELDLGSFYIKTIVAEPLQNTLSQFEKFEILNKRSNILCKLK